MIVLVLPVPGGPCRITILVLLPSALVAATAELISSHSMPLQSRPSGDGPFGTKSGVYEA